jgi:hypothetical protein
MALPLIAKRNDTFNEVPFQINFNSAPLDLTDAEICMQLRKVYDGEVFLTLSSVMDAGITITDALAGEFKINEQIISVKAGNYLYDIQITFADGTVKTWIEGVFTILNDVSRCPI